MSNLHRIDCRSEPRKIIDLTPEAVGEWLSTNGNVVFEWFSNTDNTLAVAQVFAALITALATLALWRVTRVLAVETAALAKMTSRPFVVGSLESSGAASNALNLVLKNSGNATAFDVNFALSPALPNAYGSKADDKQVTKYTISLIPPGQELHVAGVMGQDVYDKVYFTIISWGSFPNATDRETLTYTFKPTDGYRAGFITKGEHHIADELEKIRRHITSRNGGN